MKTLAETDYFRLVCDGLKHWTEDKSDGLRAGVPVSDCDCKTWKEAPDKSPPGGPPESKS